LWRTGGVSGVVRLRGRYPQRQHREEGDPPNDDIKHDTGDPAHQQLRYPAPRSRLFELDEGATKVLRVQKEHRFVVGPEPRLAIS